jgi:hypothetical protein
MLEGKVAIVYGAAGPMGSAVARVGPSSTDRGSMSYWGRRGVVARGSPIGVTAC